MAGLRENASYLHLPRRLRICRVDNAKWRCAPFDQSKRCADILRTRHFGRDAIPNAQIAQRCLAIEAGWNSIRISHRQPPVTQQARKRKALVDRHLRRSEEHTSELQSLMRISYAVFCLKKKKTH